MFLYNKLYIYVTVKKYGFGFLNKLMSKYFYDRNSKIEK